MPDVVGRRVLNLEAKSSNYLGGLGVTGFHI
jgi:hypothetical protein